MLRGSVRVAQAPSLGCTGCHSGTTTPSDTIIFSASSTDIVSSMASSRGTNTMKPEAAFGVVGTNTVTRSLPRHGLGSRHVLGSLEADAIDAFARIFDEQHFLERRAALAEQDRGEFLHGAVDGAHERDAV